MTLRYQVFGEPVPCDGSRDHPVRSICVCDECVLYLCGRLYVQTYHNFFVHKINWLDLMIKTTVIVSYNSF